MSVEITPQTEQIIARTARTLRATWYEDGVATDPGVVTVTIRRLDGSDLIVDAPTVTGGTGERSYALLPELLPEPDILTVTWSADSGRYQQTVEVVGAALFTIEHARRFDSRALLSSTQYPTAMLEQLRAAINDEFARVAGVSFVPRAARELVPTTGQRVLYLPHERVLQVRAVEVLRSSGWQAWPQVDIDAIQIGTTYGVSLRSGADWPGPREHLRVTYVHGWEQPPTVVVNAALLYLRFQAVNTNLSSRTISATNDYGSEQYWTPGYSGRGSAINELPWVDKVLRQYALKNVGVA